MQDLSAEENEWVVMVDSEAAGGRLDAVLAKALPVFSRNRLKDLILARSAAINGQTVAEPKYRVRQGDVISLLAPEPIEAEPEPEDIPLAVLFEDDQVIVVDKPAGMVVHPAPGSPSGTLVNALLFHCGDSLKGIGGVRRPGIVHRLDKDTSGTMVAAKTDAAHQHLAAQFADHGRTGPLRRAYLGFTWGRTQQASGSVEAPLGRDPHNRLKQAVRHDGREAITHYAVEARFGDEGWNITRIRCRLETGRTHQIRVHLAHIGHPLVADHVYASGFATKVNRLPEAPAAAVVALGRQALHAAELGFEHPGGKGELRFSAPLPPDLQALQDALLPFDEAFSATR